MALPTISGEFRIGTEPRIGFTEGAGVAFWNARCVMSARKEEPKGSGNWVDDKDKTLWINLSTYRKVAENMQNSGFKKGDLITITNAPIWLRTYQQDGQSRISVEVEAKEVGASLTFRTYPHHDQQGGGQQRQQSTQSTSQSQPPAQDNWADQGQAPDWARAGSEQRDYGWGGQGEL